MTKYSGTAPQELSALIQVYLGVYGFKVRIHYVMLPLLSTFIVSLNAVRNTDPLKTKEQNIFIPVISTTKSKNSGSMAPQIFLYSSNTH